MQKENDVVYVIGNGSQVDDLELRLSLRSVEKFCPWVRNVFIVGKKPKWLSNEAIHIEERDPYGHFKDANIIHKILRACNDPRVSDDFMFCSDDQLVTREVSFEDLSPHWLREWSEEDASWYDRSPWHKNLKETLRVFGPNAKYWQPHSWCPINKDKFIDMCETRRWRNSKACVVLSLYYNHINQQGDKAKEGVHGFFNAPKKEYPTMLAYSDDGIKNNEFKKELFRMFPNRSKYESFDSNSHLEKGQQAVIMARDLQTCIDARRQIVARQEEIAEVTPNDFVDTVVEATDVQEVMEYGKEEQCPEPYLVQEDIKTSVIVDIARAISFLGTDILTCPIRDKLICVDQLMAVEMKIRMFDKESADMIKNKVDSIISSVDLKQAIKILLEVI
jgi:hypothetical protein